MELREYIPKVWTKDIWAQLELPSEDAKLLEEVDNGFRVQVLYELASLMGVSQVSIAKSLRLPLVNSRSDKTDSRFTMEESNRLYSLIEALSRSVDLFDGDRKGAVEWMTKKAPALGHKRPIDMLDTHVRTQAVLDLINRLEFGVYP